MTSGKPILLDCTRLVAHRWSGSMPTGIDRVCEAYRAHFAPRAQAVVQLRGRARVLTRTQSDSLFAMLAGPRTAFRRRFAGLAAMVGAGRGRTDAAGAIYLNVSHTDFDLDRHLGWVHDSGVRPVYLVHDLIPIEHPHFTTPHKAQRHAGRVRRALESASGIIANSQTTARALGAFAAAQGVEPPPILGAPLGSPELPVPPQSGPRRRATFVCVSTIERRKNHMLLLDVWQRLIERHGDQTPRLVLIGRWGVGAQDVQQRYRADPRLHRFVTIDNDCPDAEIARHLRSASALLAPSRAEGFGLPVVEALGMGVPVIASDIPAFREVGAGIPTFLDPCATEAWLAHIEEFAANGRERRRQLAALDGYRAPEWRDHFALVDDWLTRLPAVRQLSASSNLVGGIHAGQAAQQMVAGALP
ncbi:glycosyltransferase [Erythrobacter sp. NFXS35]|uniref:glycosyltransferase n=1 Tax=Erythrobacter sp. NFXS35 TaxID=2818436 RepID=UPI0032E01E2F